MTRLRPYIEIVLPEWLLFYFRSRWLNGDFRRMCNKWINQASINNTKLSYLEISVPNISIQKEILSQLHNLSSVISNVRSNLELISNLNMASKERLERLSRRILNDVFSGKSIRTITYLP